MNAITTALPAPRIDEADPPGGDPFVYTWPYYVPVRISDVMAPAIDNYLTLNLPIILPPYIDPAAEAAVAAIALLKAGDTATGPIYTTELLPIADAEFVTKLYVDTVAAGIDSLPEAPAGPPVYGRNSSSGWLSVLPLAGGTMTGPLNYTGTGAITSRSAQDRAADGINVKDYGAIGDGTADDTVAINTALAACKALYAGATGSWSLVFPPGRYRVTGPLDFTGFRLNVAGGNVIGNGAIIYGAFTGGIVVDCTDGRWIHFHDLTIMGDATLTPAIGMQLGPSSADRVADYIRLTRCNIVGWFGLTSFYNKGSETFVAYGCYMSNNVPNAFVAVIDGINYWNATSSFVTITQPVKVQQTCKQHLWLQCNFQGVGSSGVIWLANAEVLRMVACYASNTTANSYIFSLFGLSGWPAFASMDVDCHCETTALGYVFVVTADPGVTNFYGYDLTFRDHICEAQVSIFAIDPTSALIDVVLNEVTLMTVTFGGTPTLVDTPARWSIQARRLAISGQYYQTGMKALTGTVYNMDSGSFTTLPTGQRVSAINGGSVTVSQNSSEVYLMTVAAIAGFTVTMPPVPLDGQQVRISTNNDIAALTVAGNTGQTVTYAPGYLYGNQAVEYRWDALNTAWYCLSTPQSVALSTVMYTTAASLGTNANGRLELGSTSAITTPFIDFMSQGTGTPGMRVESTGQNLSFHPEGAGPGIVTINTAGIGTGLGGIYAVNGVQVVGAPINGWGTSTGGIRGAMDAAAATLPEVAAALAQLLTDLRTHGLLGA